MNSSFGISVIVFIFFFLQMVERLWKKNLRKVENDHLIVLDVHLSFFRFVNFLFLENQAKLSEGEIFTSMVWELF